MVTWRDPGAESALGQGLEALPLASCANGAQVSPAFLTWQMGWQDLPSLREQVGWSTDRNAGESTQQKTALAPDQMIPGIMGGGFNPSCPPDVFHTRRRYLLLPPLGPTSCVRGVQKVSAWRGQGQGHNTPV